MNGSNVRSHNIPGNRGKRELVHLGGESSRGSNRDGYFRRDGGGIEEGPGVDKQEHSRRETLNNSNRHDAGFMD